MEGLAERRGWKRVPVREPVNLNTANGQATSELAILTSILGTPEQVRAAELGNAPPLLSVGRRYLDGRYSFVWVAGENP